MAEWNKIPLGLPRPESQPLDRDELNWCVADYVHSLLSRYGRVESGVILPGNADPLSIVELDPIVLASGDTLQIGQIPCVNDEPIAEAGVYSFSVSATESKTPLTLAVYDETEEQPAYTINESGAYPAIDDLAEVNDALRVLYEVSSGWIERHEALAVNTYPRIDEPQVGGFCLYHLLAKEAPKYFQPREFL